MVPICALHRSVGNERGTLIQAACFFRKCFFFFYLFGRLRAVLQTDFLGGGKALARTQAFPMARSLSVTQDLQMDLQ